MVNWLITPIEAVQPRYSLLVREVERELLPLCRDEGIGVLEQIHLGPNKRFGWKELLDPSS